MTKNSFLKQSALLNIQQNPEADLTFHCLIKVDMAEHTYRRASLMLSIPLNQSINTPGPSSPIPVIKRLTFSIGHLYCVMSLSATCPAAVKHIQCVSSAAQLTHQHYIKFPSTCNQIQASVLTLKHITRVDGHHLSHAALQCQQCHNFIK